MRLIILASILAATLHAQIQVGTSMQIGTSTEVFNQAGGVWKVLQSAGNFTCGSTNSCTVSLSSTTPGSVLVCASIAINASSVALSSCSGGGGTWNLCTSSACTNYNGVGSTVDVGYSLNGTGGATSVTVNTGSTPTFLAAEVIEIIKTGSSANPVVDSFPTLFNNSASCMDCTAASFTLSPKSQSTPGSAVVQIIDFGSTYIAKVSGQYAMTDSSDFLFSLNTTDGSAPTVTQYPAAGRFMSTGIAFK